MSKVILNELREKYNKVRSYTDMSIEDFVVFAYKQGLRDAEAYAHSC